MTDWSNAVRRRPTGTGADDVYSAHEPAASRRLSNLALRSFADSLGCDRIGVAGDRVLPPSVPPSHVTNPATARMPSPIETRESVASPTSTPRSGSPASLGAPAPRSPGPTRRAAWPRRQAGRLTSLGDVSKRSGAMKRPAQSTMTRPIATPMSAMLTLFRSTRSTMDLACAPRAMRTPISRVRCATR